MLLYKNILACRNLKRILAICCKVWYKLRIAFNYKEGNVPGWPEGHAEYCPADLSGKAVRGQTENIFIRKDRKEKRHMRLLYGILCDSLIFMRKCTPKFKKYGILVQNWFHRGEKNAI